MSDLPVHLVYKIIRSLDLRSQRNLFLCSSQLYSKWQLHIPDDKHWQFVQACINMLEKATANGLCDASSISLGFVGTSTGSVIGCLAQQQSGHFHLEQISNESHGITDGPRWSSMTKDQLWHRLTGAPDLASAELSCNSHPQLLPGSNGLEAFAQQTFDLLCITQGLLLIFMEGLEDAEEEGDEGCHTINITHAGDPKPSPGDVLHWEIDDETCIVDPPKFVFDDMPEEVTAIRAQFYSYNPSMSQLMDTHGFACFYPESQVLLDFAYKGNVDIDAWAKMQHEAANDWYDHMDDFDDDFDDMLDLDDGDMANLLGAMQG